MPAESFEFDRTDAARVSGILDRLSATASDLLEVSIACHGDQEFEALPETLQGEVTNFLGYELEDDDGRSGARLVPASDTDGIWGARPYLVETENVRRFWRAIQEATHDPLLTAQSSDLILSSKTDQGAAQASTTVRLYLDVARRDRTDSLHAAMALVRALTIARSRRMAEEEEAWSAGADVLTRLLESPSPPGGPARIFDALTTSPKTFDFSDGHYATMSRLLDAADDAYPHSDAADWVADARRRIARTSQERRDASERQVERYLESARQAQGFARMHWATRAAELAEQHELAEARSAAVRLMQATASSDMNWQTMEMEFSIPAAAMRSYMRRVARADGWQQAVTQLLATSSPTGDHGENRRSASEASAGSILALVSRTTFGAHGLPESTDTDFEESTTSRIEQWRAGVQGLLLAGYLEEIHRRFGDVAASDLGALMVARYGCDSAIAAQFGRAVELFWEGRFSDSARVAIPLTEAAARGLLLRLDEALYRTERGNTPGKFPSMDFYLDALAGIGLDPDWERALRVVLLSTGSNTRNRAAHGFQFEFSQGEAALLIRLAGLFCALPNVDDVDEARRQLSRPLAATRRKLRRRPGWVWV